MLRLLRLRSRPLLTSATAAGHDVLQALDEPRVVLGQGLELIVDLKMSKFSYCIKRSFLLSNFALFYTFTEGESSMRAFLSAITSIGLFTKLM